MSHGGSIYPTVGKSYKSQFKIFLFREPLYHHSTCYFELVKNKIHKGDMHHVLKFMSKIAGNV